MKGNLLVITGCMYGRKSLELIEEIKNWEFSNRPYLAFSPIKDSITSRGSNISIPATHIEKDHASFISYHIGVEIQNGKKIEAVAIDEVSFYSEGIVGTIEQLLENGIDVAVAGLDRDFRGKPFGSIGDLMALAVDVRKRFSVCMKCRKAMATMTQRLVNGEPAPFVGPLIVVEKPNEVYSYQCRCKDCHERG